MMIFIPRIRQKIDKKLQELNLQPLIAPEEFIRLANDKKHRYWSVCQIKRGRKVVFYARLHDNKDAGLKFQREILFLIRIKNKKLKYCRIAPKLLAAGLERDFEWLVREYLEGLPLGFSRKLEIKLPLRIAPKLAKTILQISQTPKRFFQPLRLKKFNWHYYLDIKDLYFGLVRSGVINLEIYQKIIKLLKGKEKLLKRENHYFAHGDLNLGNIILCRNGFKIIDWELIHLNNFVYDFAYLWTHLWQASKGFRRELFYTYFKRLSPARRKTFKELLPVIVVYLALGGITYQSRQERFYLLKRRNFYLKLLKNCLKDFNILIKT